MTDPAASTGADEFYVGYLTPAPGGIARRIRAVSVGLLLLVAAAAAAIGLAQAPPAGGEWDPKPVSITGLFIAEPCPMLRVIESGQVRTILLVGEGKCGALEPAGYCGPIGPTGTVAGHDTARLAMIRALSGHLVTVSGTRLSRDGRSMIELGTGERAVIAAGENPALRGQLALTPADSAEATLRGVIVDPKCYLGAMHPGEGKTHRGCAIRCISGGIPPVLVVQGSGVPGYVLLADRSGLALRDAALPYVGDDVEIRGTREQRGDMQVLRLDPDSIKRL